MKTSTYLEGTKNKSPSFQEIVITTSLLILTKKNINSISSPTRVNGTSGITSGEYPLGLARHRHIHEALVVGIPGRLQMVHNPGGDRWFRGALGGSSQLGYVVNNHG